MLTDFEYEILAFVRANRFCARSVIINNFDPQKRCNDLEALISHLTDIGCVQFSDYKNSNNAEITPVGLHTLMSWQENRIKKRKEFWIKSILVPICVSVIGTLITNWFV